MGGGGGVSLLDISLFLLIFWNIIFCFVLFSCTPDMPYGRKVVNISSSGYEEVQSCSCISVIQQMRCYTRLINSVAMLLIESIVQIMNCITCVIKQGSANRQYAIYY